jgi:dsRNA-specific ribonuclease
VEGEGNNRKEAEKAAAEIIWLKLEDIESSFSSKEISYENAINMLQEYCQLKDIPKPEYKTVNDIIFEDNTHEFTVRCTLNGRYTEGKGERVKEAKKGAAYKMLDYLGLIQ